MISLDDAAEQLNGAWKMALDHDNWRQHLSRSTEAVFSSFWAMALTTPFVILLSLLSRRAALKMPTIQDAPVLKAGMSSFAFADLSAFVIAWIAGLVFLLGIARAGGASRSAADLIVGYNWIQPITVVAQAPAIALLASTGNPMFGAMFGLPAFALSLTLYWGVIRRSLGTKAAQTVALISVLILIGFIVDSFTANILIAFNP